VRLKLDENLPVDARRVAEELGHDAHTVLDESLGGVTDPEVLAAATDEDRFLITLDRGFGDIRLYPPGSHPGIAVLRPPEPGPDAVIRALTAFLEGRGPRPSIQ
jgi:predicted nuclease of predicted toxin-antitoxin system